MDKHETEPGRLLLEKTTGAIIGVFYDVYNELGYGFPEFVLQRAMVVALTQAGLEVHAETELPVWFRGRRLVKFRVDLVVAPGVIVEVKARQTLDDFHLAQVMHYLKATDLEVGLLLNFGRRAEFRRVILQNARKPHRIEDPPAGGAVQVVPGSAPG